MPEQNFRVRIRMYRPGLGDCFLLTFQNGADERHILIDCGIFVGTANEKQRIRDIAGDIKEITKSKLDAIVATHEHWDHVAGFFYAQDIFDSFDSIPEVWLAWTEDPDQQIVQERQKLKMQLEQTLAAAVQQLAGFGSMEEQECGRSIAKVMGFNGPLSSLFSAAFARRSNDAMDYLVNRKKNNPKDSKGFLNPGEHFTVPWLPGVRVYVLGPPKDKKILGRTEGPSGTEEYFSGFQTIMDSSRNWQLGINRAALNAKGDAGSANETEGSEKAFYPEAELDEADTFNRVHRWTEEELLKEKKEVAAVIASYRSEDWRRIDSDWYNEASRLALQLDSATNNTSLVLAFELIDSGQVLLFVGDAQIGNWESWDALVWEIPEDPPASRKLTAKDLLAKTVFYKVGHHGSVNATRKMGGLESMTSPGLVAAISTDAKFSKEKEDWDMPAANVEKALLEKTRGRLLRSDITGLPKNVCGLSDASWQSFEKQIEKWDNPLFIDYWVEG